MPPIFESKQGSPVSISTSNGTSFLVDAVYADFIQRYTWRWQDDGHSNLVYPRAKIRYKSVRVHRYIYQLAYGPIEKGLVIHHINHDTADNRLENLKAITHAENIHLSRKRDEKRTSSQYWGVYRHPSQTWQAATTINGKHTHLGFFDDEVIASCAVIIAHSLYNRKVRSDV